MHSSLFTDVLRAPAWQVQPVEEDRRELVAGFSGGRLAALDAAAPVQAGKRVIPRLENTFRVTSSSGPRKFDPSRCGSSPHA
jgi:hypothetical protein